MSDIRQKIAERRAQVSGQSVREKIQQRRKEIIGGDLPKEYTVIATTEDGGRVYQKPDGTKGFVGPAMSSEQPETVARILEGATPARAYRSGMNEEIIGKHPVASRLSKFAQGYPLGIGESVDEVIGAVAGDDAMDATRAVQGAMAEERPGESLALNLGGAALGSAGIAAAVGPAALRAAPTSMAGQTAAAVGTGMTAGAVDGALSGYARGTNPTERKEYATQDGVTGSILGAGFAVGAPLVAKGASNLVGWIKQSDVGAISKVLDISHEAASIIRGALGAEDMTQATRRLRAVGDDAMLADAGPALANQLDTVMAEGGPALATGRKAVESRAQTTTPALRRAFDNILGEPKGVRASAKAVASRTAKARKAAYDAAYRQPTPTVGPKADALNAVLDRIPGDTMAAAVKEANAAMQEAGVKNMNIILDADTGKITQPLNIQQMDFIKRSLGAVASESKDNLGIMTEAGMRAARLARDLKNAIADAVPVYGRAVKMGGDNIADKQALDIGRSIFGRGVKLEDVTDVMADASKTQKSAFKQGLREAIEDTMDNVRAVLSDPNGDARQASAIWGQFSSPATRKKIEAAIGKSGANRIYKLMEREFPMLSTRSSVARGSQTAYRRAGSEAITDTLAPGVVGTAARGEPINAGKRVVQALTNTTPNADRAAREAVLKEVAEALTKTRGRESREALIIVRRAMAGQPITDAQARMVGQIAGASLSIGGSQTAKQLQGPQ